MDDFKSMIGKTILAVTQQKLIKYDDEGFLRIEFTDGTHITISGGYSKYTGGSEDEYQTTVGIVPEHRESDLINIK